MILCDCWCFGHARFWFGAFRVVFVVGGVVLYLGVFACGWFSLHVAWFGLICGSGVFGFGGWGIGLIVLVFACLRCVLLGLVGL